MRLDKLLHNLRFAKTRGVAQRWIAEGLIRCNGQRVTGQDQAIAPGDVLTLPLARTVAVIEVLSLPPRRGPASEARACYRALDARPAKAIGGAEGQPEGTSAP